MPMSMNSWALYYNKAMLKAAGIKSPPKTLAQLGSVARSTGCGHLSPAVHQKRLLGCTQFSCEVL